METLAEVYPRQKNEGITEIEEGFSHLTLVEKKEPFRPQYLYELVQFPEKCDELLDSFMLMISMRSTHPYERILTFEEVSSRIESATGRKFLLSHLLQINHLLPEAVQIQTDCMTSEMKIRLLSDVVKGHNDVSEHEALFRIFSLRLRDFIATHSETCGIPEGGMWSSSASYSSVNLIETTPMVKGLVGIYSHAIESPPLSTPPRLEGSIVTSEDQSMVTSMHTLSTATAKRSSVVSSFDGEDSSFPHKQKSVCLSRLIRFIHGIFESFSFCPLPKDVLVFDILYGCTQFRSRREVEVQLENLEKLVPYWIRKEVDLAGDCKYVVHTNPEFVYEVITAMERENVVTEKKLMEEN